MYTFIKIVPLMSYNYDTILKHECHLTSNILPEYARKMLSDYCISYLYIKFSELVEKNTELFKDTGYLYFKKSYVT